MKQEEQNRSINKDIPTKTEKGTRTETNNNHEKSNTIWELLRKRKKKRKPQ